MERAYRKRIVEFFLRGLVVWLIWYLIYDHWLEPEGALDHWLCHNLVAVSRFFLRSFNFQTFTSDNIIGLAGYSGIIIIPPCNGMEAMGLFLGFVHAFPGRPWRRWIFSIAGLITIYMTNVVRIIVLVLTQRYWPALFDFTHHYSSTAIFYVVVFLLWVLWAYWGTKDYVFFRSLQGALIQEEETV